MGGFYYTGHDAKGSRDLCCSVKEDGAAGKGNQPVNGGISYGYETGNVRTAYGA